MNHFIAVTLACALDACYGYPDFIYKKIKHPVVWMGAVISWLDQNFNRQLENATKARITGLVCMIYLLAITFIISYAIAHYLGFIGQLIGIAALLAGRSLYQHVSAVHEALKHGNKELAQEKLAKIVGRDVEILDEAGICRASIESLAESFCDGLAAPVFWAIIFGLPGIACYKAINTADSMIGHKTERYKYFGWAAARLDDAANFIPARLSFLIIYLSSLKPIESLAKAAKDAKKHRSVNAGYPESAMAYALNIELGGARSYDGETDNAPLIGAGLRRDVNITDLENALDLFIRCCFSCFIIMLIATFY